MQGSASDRPFAIARGQELLPFPDLPPGIESALAAIIAVCPEAKLTSLGADRGWRSATYAELWDRSARIGAGLQSLGLLSGQAVVLLTEDSLDFVPAFWACLRGGLMAVPLSSAAADASHERGCAALREILARLDRPVLLADATYLSLAESLAVEAKAIVVAMATAEASVARLRSVEPAEPVCLIATSGSTGRLKLAALGQAALSFRFLSNRRTALISDAPYLCTFPHDSITGLRVAFLWFRHWVQAPARLLMARPLLLLDGAETFRAAWVTLTCSLASQVLAAADRSDRHWNLGALRRVGFAGEMVVRGVARRFDLLVAANGGPEHTAHAGYGTTESGPLVLASEALCLDDASQDTAPVQLGRCLRGVELRIVDDQGHVLAEGETGELQARCPQTFFAGYWDGPDAINAEYVDGQWWRTGDVGKLDDGCVTLLGRHKDVLVIRGKKYALEEIDTALYAALGVQTYSCAVRRPGEATEGLAVAFLPLGHETSHTPADIRRLTASQFGLLAEMVVPISPELLPFTATGKFQRAILAERIAATAPLRTRLLRIWQEVLETDADLDQDANFFDLGGDSLRSAELFVAVEEEFDRFVPVSDFFANPTFGAMLGLIGVAGASDTRQENESWPLPYDLRQRLLSYIETWDGLRPTRQRLVTGLNTTGTKPPLFWIFQDGDEFSALAGQLGTTQPLYGLRSAHRILNYTEDLLQRLALAYVHEIEETCPEGSLFLGGNCQGGLIALAVAQHLLRRGRHLPLLVLMEWIFPIQPYPGPVLLLYGRDSAQGNPYRRHSHPHLAWGRAYADSRRAEIPGAHGTFFHEPNVPVLGATLVHHLAEALPPSPQILPHSARQAVIEVSAIPARMTAGQRCVIDVAVTNISPIAWNGWEQSGIALGCYWVDKAGTILSQRDDRVPLPALMPGGKVRLRLSVTAPRSGGELRAMIDLVEEGSAWFHPLREAPFQAIITVDESSHTPIEEMEEITQHLRQDADRLLRSRSWRTARALRNLLNAALGRSGEQIPTVDGNWRNSLIHIRNIRDSLSWDLTAPLRLPSRLLRRVSRPEPPAESQSRLPVIFYAVVDTAHSKSSMTYGLAASWHAHCRGWSTLHLTMVGEDLKLERFAASLGVHIEHRTSHPHTATIPFANKWLAASASIQGRRAVLLDTDVVFLGDPWLFRSLPPDYFSARPAPSLRVPPGLQEWAMETLFIPGSMNLANFELARSYRAGMPLSEISADSVIRRLGYYNTGVVVFPAGRFKSAMDSWSQAYASMLDCAPVAAEALGSQEASAPLINCDQFAFTVALAEQPFWPLDCTHNFIGSDLITGASDRDVAIMHFPGVLNTVERHDPTAVLKAFDEIMRGYGAEYAGTAVRFTRFDIGRLRLKIAGLVESYGLEHLSS